MKNAKIFIVPLTALVAAAAFAEEAEAPAAVEKSDSGRWTLSAGPAWRSRAKAKTYGTVFGPAARTSSKTTTADPGNSANWNLESAPSPVASDPDPVWVTANPREIHSVRSGDRSLALESSEKDSPCGATVAAGFDFWRGETFSAGLNLRFAAYEEIETRSHGVLGSSSTRDQKYLDRYYFLNDLYTGDPDLDLDPNVSKPEKTPYRSDLVSDTGWREMKDGRAVATRFRTELYQIGFGPKVTWTPFAGCGSPWSRFDVVCGAELLANFVRNELDADGASESDTDCLFGFGVNAGLVFNVRDWFGVYGQAGYEWIEDSDISAGGFTAEVDYSSFVLSAGVEFKF